MKSLKQFIEEQCIDEAKIQLANNIFFNLFKSNSLDEFKYRLLEIKSKVDVANAKPVKTKKLKYLANISFDRNLPSKSYYQYELSSDVSKENQYFIVFCTEDIPAWDECDGIIEFGKYPRLYFGNNKKMIVYKWNNTFNDVGWDSVGGRKGINNATFPTQEIYKMPDELVQDCIDDLSTFKGKTKRF